MNPGWGQSFGYDGCGNLTTVNVTKGTAPSLSATYSASTNRRTDDCADANGNISPCSGSYTYDIANRIKEAPISGGGTVKYAYSNSNQRVWKGVYNSGGTQTGDEITFYSAGGAKLVSYNLSANGSDLVATSTGYYEYFGGKLIKNATGYVNQDRLGSRGKYFPYGQDRGSNPSNGSEKFATYTRDSETGLDYAQNRYHSSGDGRFLTPDPYQASAGPSDPGSWNRYAYVGGDPVNFNDPKGLYQNCPAGTHAVNKPGGTGYCQRDEDNSGSIAKACANPGAATIDAAFWQILCSNGAGADTGTDRDPSVTIVEIAKSTANDLNKEISNGKYSSCEALARFAERIAANTDSLFELVEAFDVLIPAGGSGGAAGLGGIGNGILLGTGTGYAQKYQEGYGSASGAIVGANQSHHFAMFFKLGFLFGFGPAAVANLREVLEGTPDNQGDINLGLEAAAIGAALRPDSDLRINSWDLADTIRSSLCTR